MPAGLLTLAEFPLEMVEFACVRCRRRGQLLKAKLIEAYGADVPLPDLSRIIARCDRANGMPEQCGAYYVALTR
jgi:hypothetical protein